MRGSIDTALTAVGISLLVGCSDPVTPETVAGTYVATTFTLSGAVTEDVLEAGGSLTITFDAGGTTSGSLFLPATSSASEGVDFTADMAGTFDLTDDDRIRIAQDADSFVRVLRWKVDGNLISGSNTVAGVTVTVVLSRQ